MSCKTNKFPAGWNKNCIEFIAEAKGAILTKPGVSIPMATAQNKSAWMAHIRQSIDMVYYDFSSYEVTAGEIEIQTDDYGRQIPIRNGAPSATTYLNLGKCDFRELLNAAKGDNYGIFFVLEDDSIHGWRYELEFRPFSALLYASNQGIPTKGEIQKFNQLGMYFSDKDQFDAYELIDTQFDTTLDFKENMPTGYDIRPTAAYNGTVYNAFVNLRCDAGEAGFALADFEVVDSFPAGASITAVSAGAADGDYDISIALTADQWADIRLKKVDGSSNVTDVSSTVRVEG